MRPKANASGSRIRIDAEKSIVRAFVGGLNREEIAEIIKQANIAACQLLEEHASRHKFRPPHILRWLAANGQTIWAREKSETVWDEQGVTAWATNFSPIDVSYLEAEDGSGQKFSVRVELEAV